MARVAITGLGIVSAIGNDLETVVQSLREARSGMIHLPEMAELGYRCQVFAPVSDFDQSSVPRSLRRTMSRGAVFAAKAAFDALEDAGLTKEALIDGEAGDVALMVGTGGAGAFELPLAEEAYAAGKKIARLGGVTLGKIMNTTASGNLAAHLGITGRTGSLSAACATGLYNIGHAYELIRHGIARRAITGSCEEAMWKLVGLSADNSAGMPVDYNDRPEQACRPFDRDHQGFVISEGAGILVLEELESAQARGARIYAEIVGYGAGNDGDDMFIPTGEGLRLSIEAAMASARESGVDGVDYVNAHGTGTPIGDKVESEALYATLGDAPYVGSTKSISGHSQGATASQEVVYTTLMLANGFVAPTRNLDVVDEACAPLNYARTLTETSLGRVMSVNSGLGGVNACLVMRRL